MKFLRKCDVHTVATVPRNVLARQDGKPYEDTPHHTGMDPNQGFLGPFRAFNEAQAAAYLAQYKDAFGQTAASRHINTRTEPAARVPSSSPSGAKSFDQENAVRPLLEGDSDIRPFQSHLFLPFVAAIMTSESILEQVRSILGPDLLVWFTEWHTKPPLSKKGYAPHQDSTYAGLEPPEDVVTVWVALTAATKANGCLQFVPMRRYNGRQLPHIEEPGDPSNALLKGQYIPRATLDFEENAEFVELQAGEATIHAFRCVHASGPNTTSSPRVGLAIRYMKPSVQQLAGQRREGAMLVSGKDEWGHFDLLPVPCEAWREEGLMLHRKEMEAMQVNYMRQQQEGQKEEG